MVKRRTGLDPLAYMGVEPSMPAQFVRESRVPTTTDYDGFNIGTVWLVMVTNQVFMLVDKSNLIGTWREFTAGVGAINTLTGDVGGAVPPTANNINIQGGDHFVFTGNPGASSLTLTSDGTVATQFDTDAGSAIPAADILQVLGGAGVATAGAGNTVTISAAGSVAVQIDTDVGGPVVPVAGVLEVFGGNNITTTGVGNRVTADLTGTTDFAVQRGNAGGSLTSVPVGLDGQVIIGATAAAPLFATMTSTGGTIIFTPGANTLNLENAATAVDVVTDAGTATIAAGILNVVGGANISTSGAGNTVTVVVSGTANFNPQMGNATGSLSDIGTMTDGDLIIGSTGVAPAVAQLTAGVGIGIANAAGSITITATGAATGDTVVTTFNASGTWTQNANARFVIFYIFSSGAGGGSGGRGATRGNGGAGGGSGGPTVYSIPASLIGATETVTIAALAAGGAAQASDNSSGNAGTNFNISTFGTTFPIPGGINTTSGLSGGGQGGGISTSAPSGGISGLSQYHNTQGFVNGGTTQSGGRGGVTTGSRPQVGNTFVFCGPGGGGGGMFDGTGFSGADSREGSLINPPGIYTFGTAGTGGATGVAGGDGNDAGTETMPYHLAGIGGGGGGGHATNPGAGGDGGIPAGAGGGGGGVVNGNLSGAGGDGARGQVIVIEFLGA